MIYLLLSLISSSAIFLIFKWFGQNNVDTFKAIVINYYIAAIFGLLLIAGEFNFSEITFSPLIRNGVLLGFLFIGLFFLMATISQKMGAGISSVATKLSLVIPAIFFMVTDSSDGFSWFKIIALILAIPGIILTVYSKGSKSFMLILPLILFVGSGVLDIVLAYSEGTYAKNDTDRIILTLTPFLISAAVGTLILIFSKSKSISIDLKSLLAGAVLGLVNFASIYFLLKTFETIQLSKSQIIPINNLGIVVMSALGAYLIMKERLSKRNFIGLFISVIAILILALEGFI